MKNTHQLSDIEITTTLTLKEIANIMRLCLYLKVIFPKDVLARYSGGVFDIFSRILSNADLREITQLIKEEFEKKEKKEKMHLPKGFPGREQFFGNGLYFYEDLADLLRSEDRLKACWLRNIGRVTLYNAALILNYNGYLTDEEAEAWNYKRNTSKPNE